MCKQIKLILLFLVFVHLPLSAQSVLSIKENDQLKLTKVGTSNGQVKIDGLWRRATKPAYTFYSKKEILLGRGQYIIVANATQGSTDIRICGNDFIETNTKTIKDYIIQKRACSKGLMETEDFRNYLERYPWFMVEDTLYIPTNQKLDKKHRFVFRSVPDNIILNPIPYVSGTDELAITKTYLDRKQVFFSENNRIQFIVEYWEDNNYKTITDKLIIEYIPKQ